MAVAVFLWQKFVSLFLTLSVCVFIMLPLACSPASEQTSADEVNQNREELDGFAQKRQSSSPPRGQKGDQNKGPTLILPVPYSGKLVSLSKLNIRDARLDELLTSLTAPWAFEFINEREIIITEISGKLSRFNLESREQIYISGLPKIATKRTQTGLLDVELHPSFKQNNRIYFSYTASDEDTGNFFRTVVVTAILKGDSLHELREITPPGHFGWSPSNFGGALEFDAQGYLYISIGDRSEGVLSQQGDRLEGKILRLHDDGSVPADNPFVGNDEIDDRIYALGVRNPQGLHFDEASGILFETEHGPMGGDEVNIIVSGANYGWPTIGYGNDYLTLKKKGATHKTGLKQPLFYYLPSIATSPITVYRGAMFHEWDGDLLVGALGGHHVSKLDLDNSVIRSEYPILEEINGRIRDIKVAKDGSILILSESGTLYRLYRDPSLKVEIKPAEKGFYYPWVCAGCHDTGVNSAPILGNKADWKEIAKLPIELVYERVMNGYNLMPERGLCHKCTDEQLRDTVDYMLEQAR